MRLLIASMILCCGAVTGYSQETVGAPEAPVEITTTDDGSGPVVVITDSNKDKPDSGGCGCGKGNKPK